MSLTDGMVQPPQTSDQMRNLAYAYNLAWDSIFLIHCRHLPYWNSHVGAEEWSLNGLVVPENKGEKNSIGSPALEEWIDRAEWMKVCLVLPVIGLWDREIEAKQWGIKLAGLSREQRLGWNPLILLHCPWDLPQSLTNEPDWDETSSPTFLLKMAWTGFLMTSRFGSNRAPTLSSIP